MLNTTAYLDGWRVPGMLRLMGGPLGIVVLGAMASAVLGPRMTAGMLRQAVARPERLTPAVVEGYWRPLHEGATQPFRQMLTSFDTVIQAFDRYAAALRLLDAPALIVWGGQDRALDATKIPAQFARDLRVPPERVQVLPQAGHFLQEDEPAEVARLISEFVSSRQRVARAECGPMIGRGSLAMTLASGTILGTRRSLILWAIREALRRSRMGPNSTRVPQ